MKTAKNATTQASTKKSANAEQVSNTLSEVTLVKRAVVNQVSITGNLGARPVAVAVASGKNKSRFSVATNRYYKNKEGVWQSETTWHNVVAWGKLAEFAMNQLGKGMPVQVEGRLNYRMYTDSNGSDKFIAEIIAGKIVSIPRSKEEQRLEKAAA
ncbi:MAG: single-stranded DNA-binding protein [Bacteroidota bacterium]|jgi:single-strand DNA-binding protein